MKIIQIVCELKQGLPNYSSRAASVTAIADESESLNVDEVIKKLTSEIKQAWGIKSDLAPALTTPEALELLRKDESKPSLDSELEKLDGIMKAVPVPKRGRPRKKDTSEPDTTELDLF